MGISHTGLQTPSEKQAPPKLQSLSTRIFFGHHATSFIGSALYASASSFETVLEKSFIGGQHLVAYAWIAHISAKWSAFLHIRDCMSHQNFQCNVAEVLPKSVGAGPDLLLDFSERNRAMKSAMTRWFPLEATSIRETASSSSLYRRQNNAPSHPS